MVSEENKKMFSQLKPNLKHISILSFMLINCIVRVSIFKIPYWIFLLAGVYFLSSFPLNNTSFNLKLKREPFTKTNLLNTFISIYTGFVLIMKIAVISCVMIGATGIFSFLDNSELKNQLLANYVQKEVTNKFVDNDNNNTPVSDRHLNQNKEYLNYRKSLGIENLFGVSSGSSGVPFRTNENYIFSEP